MRRSNTRCEDFIGLVLLLRTTAFVLPRPPRTASVTVRHESVEELQAAAAKLREEIKVEEASLAAGDGGEECARTRARRGEGRGASRKR